MLKDVEINKHINLPLSIFVYFSSLVYIYGQIGAVPFIESLHHERKQLVRIDREGFCPPTPSQEKGRNERTDGLYEVCYNYVAYGRCPIAPLSTKNLPSISFFNTNGDNPAWS